jgi:diguanylate cyclase (GGDEF)-like protein
MSLGKKMHAVFRLSQVPDRYLAVLALCCMMSPGGLAETSTAPAAATAAQLQPVSVQLKWTHQFQFAGYYAALHQGYYRDVGLDVDLTEHEPGNAPIDQLIVGRAQFAVADSGALIYAAAGVPLVALAAIFQNSPSILITRDEADIETLADLKHKRAMLSGGYMNAELMSMLQTAGIGPADIQLVPSDIDIGALLRGETDAFNGYTTNEPYLLQQRNVPFKVFRPSDYGVDFYGDILLTTEAILKAQPEMVRSFREATLKGWNYAVAHPQEMVDLILEHYNTRHKSRDHLLYEAEETVRMILPNVVPIGYMNLERWQRIEAIFREQGMLTQEVDLDRFMFDPQENRELRDLLLDNRRQLLVGCVLLIAILMLIHIARLRSQIASHTRALQQAKLQAETEARTDALTNLPNRRHFMEELGRDIAQVERHNMPLFVISLDIDYFKQVNDRYGHAAGDEVLRQAGDIFRKYTRAGDFVARLGGEEFALACLNTGSEQAHTLANRICSEMASSPVAFKGAEFQVTISLGIAEYERGDDVERLLRRADLALYKAKEGGRNRVCE